MNSKMTLGDIAEVVMGQSPIGESCNQKGIGLPLLNGPTEFGYKYPQPVQFTTESKRESNTGDLLFCVRGSTTGKMNWANQPYSIGRGLAAIRGKNGYPNIFIRAIIEYQLDSLLAKATGSTFPNVSRDLICSLDIPRISCHKAIQIAAIIEPLDNRISLLRETNTTLEAIAQTLFKSWFVDFDPVKAKAQGKQPEGMDEATAALFPSEFEESALGLIPKGWSECKIESLLELCYGKALKATDRIEGEIPVYGSGGVTGYHNKALINDASIVVGRKGTVGTLYWEDRPFFPIDTVFYVKTNKPLTYCFYLLQTLGLEHMNTDAAVPGLNRNNVYRLKFCLPTDNVLMKFDGIVALLREKLFTNNQQSQTLTTLRDTLLPRLISGQLRINQAQDVINEVGA